MRYALFWSGKDSLLALDRARQQGLEVTHLVNIYEGSSGRVRFHGVRKDAIATQTKALGVELLQRHTHPETFEQAFRSAMEDLQRLGVGGIVFGNIHLADIREWYEQRTTGMGFRHVEPLWGDSPSTLIREFVNRGHRARIVTVYLTCGRREWIGREFSDDLIVELERAENTDVCGERGGVLSVGPCFNLHCGWELNRRWEMENHLILDFSVSATPRLSSSRR